MYYLKQFRALIILIALIPFTSQANTEEIEYKVLNKENNIEVRQYAPYIKAKISFDNKKDFEKEAFRALFKYISGSNIVNQEIDMTAPVFINENNKTNRYSMSFVLPAKFTMESAPIPVDERIKLKFVDSKLKAAIRFSGYMWDYKVEKYTTDLKNWIKSNGEYEISSNAYRAGYNPPLTLPFNRRNEILLDLVTL